MSRQRGAIVLTLASFAAIARGQTTRAVAPDEFRDPETGVRIVRMSRIPNERAGVIYFTQGTPTADSKRALFHVQFNNNNSQRHLYTFDLTSGAVTAVVTDRITANQEFSPRTNNVYYLADHAAWSTNIDTLATRKIADLPADWSVGAGLTINVDETLLAGATDIGGPATQPATAASTLPAETARLKSMGSTFDAHRPNLVYTIDLRTGEVRVIHRINTWLGHLQFSPTDPTLLMFCHEGPWEKVDRIWTIHPGDAEPTCAYKRTEPREIAGHESWSPDGTTIWFQDTFRGRDESYLAGVNVKTGTITKYRQPAGGGGIHQFLSPDGTFFVGDGGGKQATGPGKYLTVQVPDDDTLKVTKIASFQNNDYAQCEPNPHLTPDQKWVVFTATFGGPPQAWAAEMPEQYWRK